MNNKEDWKLTIKKTNFDEVYDLFVQLNSIERFSHHNSQDTVLMHTSRMLEIHTQLLRGRINDFEYFAILFHDFEEIFTGDIPYSY